MSLAWKATWGKLYFLKMASSIQSIPHASLQCDFWEAGYTFYLGKAVATAEMRLCDIQGYIIKKYIVSALFSWDVCNPATIFWGCQAAPRKDHVWVSWPPSHLRSQLEASTNTHKWASEPSHSSLSLWAIPTDAEWSKDDAPSQPCSNCRSMSKKKKKNVVISFNL